jgi:sugar O-acyltransferase (sialic acid O-acetyltransferase NeuD family)
MKILGIFGTSGMARETGDIALELGYKPVYIAQDQSQINAWTFPDEIVLESKASRYRDMAYVIGIGDNKIRQKIAQRFDRSLDFTNLIHPTATFGKNQRDNIDAAKGVIICAGARFTNNIQVGNFVIVNQNATIAHDVTVEDFVNVAPMACILGNVRVCSGCWIGAGAIINQGTNAEKIAVNADTIVGSGAVVTKTCEANAVYAGVPAKRIK